MQFQQPHTRSIRLAASTSSLDYSIRKGTVRSRPTLSSMYDLDDVDMAHAMLASPSRAPTVASMRDGSRDVRSFANLQRIAMLQEIFPDVAVELIEDVLIAAQFRTDFAAAMLTEMSREAFSAPNAPDHSGDAVLIDWTAIQSDSDSDDEDAELWHDIAASRPELQQWIMVQDDWEVVDSAVAPASPTKQTSRTFADVLRTSGSTAAANSLPSLARVSVTTTTTLSPLVPLKKHAAQFPCDADELSVKSFGSRKRRYQRKFRR